MSEIPDALAGFVPWLEGNGFLRTSDRFEPEAFGNRLITLERPPITVEIVSDRGVWLLGVGGQALTEGTFGAEIWRACLERIAGLRATDRLHQGIAEPNSGGVGA